MRGAAERFPFSEFEQIVASLDSRVRDGGLFVLFNANYRLTDTGTGKSYRRIILPGMNLETIPKANKAGKVLDRKFTEVLFRKAP